MEINIHTDGASRGNPGPGSYGFIIETGEKKYQGSGFLGRVTNNVAEYNGAIRSLEQALTLASKGDEIRLISDSQLLINQLSGKWRIRDDKLKKLKKQIDSILSKLAKRGVEVKFEKVEREDEGVKKADRLCNFVLDSI